MKVKIENTPWVKAPRTATSDVFHSFLENVPKLEVGQSFMLPYVQSHFRIAATCARIWLGVHITIVREGNQWRIGRVA